MIDRLNKHLSLTRQCQLLGLSRSSLYYQPATDNTEDLALMALIDRQFLETPYYGSRKMTAWLRREGHVVNRKRVRRLMRQMGLQVIWQKPNTSKPNPKHKVYPYLLRGVPVTRPNHVWSTDVTYIRLARGFALPGAGPADPADADLAERRHRRADGGLVQLGGEILLDPVGASRPLDDLRSRRAGMRLRPARDSRARAQAGAAARHRAPRRSARAPQARSGEAGAGENHESLDAVNVAERARAVIREASLRVPALQLREGREDHRHLVGGELGPHHIGARRGHASTGHHLDDIDGEAVLNRSDWCGFPSLAVTDPLGS